jgi:hypothetical protein
MIIRNIFLTLFAVLVVFGIASDRLFVSDTGGDIVTLESPVENIAPAVSEAARIPSDAVASPAVSSPVMASAQIAQPVQNSFAVALQHANPVNSDEQAVSSHLLPVAPLNIVSRTTSPFVSEWLSVPKDVIDHVRSLPQPIPRYDNGYLWNRPVLRDLSLTESKWGATSAAIGRRTLLPLIPVANSTSVRSLPLAEIKASRISSEIARRQLLPLLPKHIVSSVSMLSSAKLEILPQASQTIASREPLLLYAMPTVKRVPAISASQVQWTASLPVSTSIAARPLLSALPISLTANQSLALAILERTAPEISSAVGHRPLSPILSEHALAKPVFRTQSLLEMASVLTSTSIVSRPLSPVLPMPSLGLSLADSNILNTSASLATRPLQPLMPDAIAAMRPVSFSERPSSDLSSEITSRTLFAAMPSSIAGGTISQSEMVSSIAAPIGRRPLLPVVEAPIISKPSETLANKTNSRNTQTAPINAEFTAVNIAQKPVVINRQATFSPALLGPLSFVPAPSDIASDAPSEKITGPASDSTGEVTANAVKEKAPLPFLVTAQAGFSAGMLKPLSSTPVFPPNPDAVNGRAVADAPDGSYCDPNFVGPPIRFSQTAELKLEDLLNQLNSRFGVNFVVGPGIGQLPLNVKAGSIPWNVLLRSQLYISGVRAQCIDANTIELVLSQTVPQLSKSEPIVARYIKLKYLQPSSGENKNVAGQSTGGSGSQGGGGSSGGEQTSCRNAGGAGGGGGSGQDKDFNLPQRCKFERLYFGIQKVLGINSGTQTNQPSPTTGLGAVETGQAAGAEGVYREQMVTQVPGRNMFYVRGTAAEIKDIEEMIRHADVPPFQVVIKGLVYTANEDKLKDIGLQTTILDLGKGKTQASLTGHTLGSPLGTLFDFSTLIGTVSFNVQAAALQRNGVISVKSRPFATVLDGDTTDLTVGRQVPVVIEGTNIGIGGTAGTLEILQAANLLNVTPHVIDDEKGNPTAVSLELRLESNDVDQTVSSQGVPAISVRSIQSNIILNQEQTAILGGFTVDSDSKTVSKTPGLGDVPIFGELFKRRVRASQINRLYFAISVTVIPYGGIIEPVIVPGATTGPPSLTPELLKRAKESEPKVVAPTKDPH